MIKEIKVNSILNGMSPSMSIAGEGQYYTGSAIDPTFQANNYEDYGFLRPVLHTKFSASEITGVPLWMIKNPKTENTYVYTSDGKVHTVSNTLTMGTALNSGNALTTASGNGAAYYDNYAYFATNTDITRYGPLNGSPSLNQVYWTTTLGKTVLTNTTYPSINGITIPNHPMYVSERKNILYIGDVIGSPSATALIGRGVVHRIITTKTTVEGDTDDGSSYNALDLPAGYYPTAMAETSEGELVIACIDGTATTISQRKAKLVFWDHSATTWSKIVEVDDPLITALRVVNGTMYIFTGDATTQRAQVRYYAGGFSTAVAATYNGFPSLPGAVTTRKERLVFGTQMDTNQGNNVNAVLALGSEDGRLIKKTALHSIASIPGSGQVSALAFILPGKSVVIGASTALFKNDQTVTIAATGATAQIDWSSMRYKIGRPFQVIGYSFARAGYETTYSIQPYITTDDGTSWRGTTVSTANYGTTKRIVYKFNPASTDGIPYGANDVQIEFEWVDGLPEAILLPITILVDILDDGD
jgi:hypothetical protein